jgi:hypothetical protein
VACDSVNGVRTHQPSHPDDVDGRCGVAGVFVSVFVAGASVDSFSPTATVWVSGSRLSVESVEGAGGGIAGTGGVGGVSGIPDRPVMASAELARLEVSSDLLWSYLLRSGAFFDLTVPPKMFSRATDVTADAFGGRGHEPYQLRARRICFSPPALVGACSPLLADLKDGICGVARFGVDTAASCDVVLLVVSLDGSAAGSLEDDVSAGLGRGLLRGAIMRAVVL